MAKSVKTLTLILVIIQKDKKNNPVEILKFDINHCFCRIKSLLL